MLYQFLEKYRSELLEMVEEKTLRLAGKLSSSDEMKKGLPRFYELLISFLKHSPLESPGEQILVAAAQHGKELLRLSYSLSHVVHAYGAVCQAITELAQNKKIRISAKEFNDLNLCLDIAIAAAVSEFQFHSVYESEQREVHRLGFLAHELRNSLSSVTIAHEMIKQGLVGTGGSTARVLEENLLRMQKLIDRSLSEVRMRSEPEIIIEKFDLADLVDQILLTSQTIAREKKQILKNHIAPKIEMETDRQLLLSAIANLTQNALKYSKVEGHISVNAKTLGQYVVIEVQDECGGVDLGRIDNLFKPFTSAGGDQSGLGLGLTIVQRAVSLLQGKILVHNQGLGCKFVMEIPRILIPQISIKTIVTGVDSVQPKVKKFESE